MNFNGLQKRFQVHYGEYAEYGDCMKRGLCVIAWIGLMGWEMDA